jgi:hypothetical protein
MLAVPLNFKVQRPVCFHNGYHLRHTKPTVNTICAYLSHMYGYI